MNKNGARTHRIRTLLRYGVRQERIWNKRIRKFFKKFSRSNARSIVKDINKVGISKYKIKFERNIEPVLDKLNIGTAKSSNYITRKQFNEILEINNYQEYAIKETEESNKLFMLGFLHWLSSYKLIQISNITTSYFKTLEGILKASKDNNDTDAKTAKNIILGLGVSYPLSSSQRTARTESGRIFEESAQQSLEGPQIGGSTIGGSSVLTEETISGILSVNEAVLLLISSLGGSVSANSTIAELIAEVSGNAEATAAVKKLITDSGGYVPETLTIAELIAKASSIFLYPKAISQLIASFGGSSFDIVKEWADADDDRVRTAHSEADGQVRNIDKDFLVGGYAMKRPKDPSAPKELTINCRCVTLFYPFINGIVVR